MVSDKFTEEIAALLKDRLGEVEVMVHNAEKNNGLCLTGLAIRGQGSNIAPCIYLEDFYPGYSEGRRSLEDITDEIIQIYHRDRVGHSFDLSVFTDYSHVRHLLHGRLVNTEKNMERLKGIPHREFLDLSLVYCVAFPCMGSQGAGSVQITDKCMGLWKVSEQDLYEQAMENMAGADNAYIFSMADIFADIQAYIPETTRKQTSPMYVLTNRNKLDGAVQILNSGVLRKAAGIIGQDFFILPSSIHETILVPAGETDTAPEELAAVVREVNEEAVSEEEFLSGHVYHYCTADGQITIAA